MNSRTIVKSPKNGKKISVNAVFGLVVANDAPPIAIAIYPSVSTHPSHVHGYHPHPCVFARNHIFCFWSGIFFFLHFSPREFSAN